MYADQTLTPKESIRLCALGTLALEERRYSDLAVAIRHFISRIIGPTPEIMGHSIELLRYEGLVETVEGAGDEAVLRITDDGRSELRQLLLANVRPSSTELTKLVIALKFRFLHLLDVGERTAQVRLLAEVCERELTRLRDLRDAHAGDEGCLILWLDHDMALLESRMGWLRMFAERLEAAPADATRRHCEEA
jgi:DNA-binding PadR family transcriptional regulator